MTEMFTVGIETLFFFYFVQLDVTTEQQKMH